MRHYKLVRDRIPEIIRAGGGAPITHVASNEEYGLRLDEKLLEEIEEFFGSREPEELADILEVVFALAAHAGISREELERLRAKKAEERGAFTQRIILEEA